MRWAGLNGWPTMMRSGAEAARAAISEGAYPDVDEAMIADLGAAASISASSDCLTSRRSGPFSWTVPTSFGTVLLDEVGTGDRLGEAVGEPETIGGRRLPAVHDDEVALDLLTQTRLGAGRRVERRDRVPGGEEPG